MQNIETKYTIHSGYLSNGVAMDDIKQEIPEESFKIEYQERKQ